MEKLTRLPLNIGDKEYISSDLYKTAMTVVAISAQSAEAQNIYPIPVRDEYSKKSEGSMTMYERIFSPSELSIEKEDFNQFITDFLKDNYPTDEITQKKSATLSEKLQFLDSEGYSAAPIFKSESGRYASHSLMNTRKSRKCVGGIISDRKTAKEQVGLLAKELNDGDFIFAQTYRTKKDNMNLLSSPLSAVASVDEANELYDDITMDESRVMARNDYTALSRMPDKVKKECWRDASRRDVRAFQFAPDEIRRSPLAIQATIGSCKNDFDKVRIVLNSALDGLYMDNICRKQIAKGLPIEYLPDGPKERLGYAKKEPVTHIIKKEQSSILSKQSQTQQKQKNTQDFSR